MSDFEINPIIWWPLLVVLVLITIALFGWSFFTGIQQRSRLYLLWGLRIAILLLIALMLLLPQQRLEEVTTLRPQLAVVVDTSLSMVDPVDEEQPLRGELINQWVNLGALEGAAQTFDLRIFQFDDRLREVPDAGLKPEFEFEGGQTRLVASLMQLEERFRGQPLAGVLLFTDALDTESDVPPPALSTAVYSFELERPFEPPPRERRISIAGLDYPQRIVVDWDAQVRVSLAGSGMTGEAVTVELWRDDQRMEETSVAFDDDDQIRSGQFTVSSSTPGIIEYELRVAHPDADEDAQAYPFLVEVLDPLNRVLYLQNTLTFDFRFLRRAIMSDPHFELDSYVRWADGRVVRMGDWGADMTDAELDFSREGLSPYSVIVLGDVPMDALPPGSAELILEFVDRGGGLVVLGGSEALGGQAWHDTPLSTVLPVEPGPLDNYREGHFTTDITDSGLRHPALGPIFAQVSELPDLLTVNILGTPKAAAEVLMETEADGRRVPLVVTGRYGQGRVVMIGSDTIWRWRLGAREWLEEASPYDAFWVQLMEWLAPEELDQEDDERLELFAARSSYVLGERPEIRAILRLQPGARMPGTLPLAVHSPDGRTLDYQLEPGTFSTAGGRSVDGYQVRIEPHTTGVHRLEALYEIGDRRIEGETSIVITRPVTELTGNPMDREWLMELTETTGGKFLPLGSWDDWQEDVDYEVRQFSRLEVKDLWNHPFLLSLIFILLTTEWLIRRRGQLP